MFQHDLNQKSKTSARNQGSARYSAKYADTESGVEAIESDDGVDGDVEAGVGGDEVVEL